jgi:hypothetical protein
MYGHLQGHPVIKGKFHDWIKIYMDYLRDIIQKIDSTQNANS